MAAIGKLSSAKLRPPVLDRTNAADVYFISSTIAGELFYGAYNSTSVDNYIGEVKQFIADGASLV